MTKFEANYKLILKELQKLESDNSCYFKPIKSKLSDLELDARNIKYLPELYPNLLF